MYKMVIVTAIGNYVAEMTPEQEEPTNDDLMKMFLETKNDVENGCFMEGWTPTDKLKGPPGVFSIGKGMEVLAYHVERTEEVQTPPIEEPENKILPLTLKFIYLGNEMVAKCVQTTVDDVTIIFCYSLNGEPPTDVLSASKITETLCKCVYRDLGFSEDEYLLQVSDDGKVRNFSQAVEVLEMLAENYDILKTQHTGKAWTGWKGDEE